MTWTAGYLRQLPNDQLSRRLPRTPTRLQTTSPTTSPEAPLAGDQGQDGVLSSPNPNDRSFMQHRVQPGALTVLFNKP